MEERISRTIAHLQQNNMAGFYAEDQEKLLSLLSAFLTEGEKIGCGDSVTLEETGVFHYLRSGKYEFYDKHRPGQVIVVVGTNKITDTLEEAVYRTRQTAAPLDARKLGKDTPCVTLGRCIDCKHENRICNDFVLIARQFVKDRIKVIILNGNYGL